MMQEFAQADVSVRVRPVTRLDLPSRIYIIEVMVEIDLEPEVEAFLETWWPANHSADFLPEDQRWYPEGRCGPSCPSHENLPDRTR